MKVLFSVFLLTMMGVANTGFAAISVDVNSNANALRNALLGPGITPVGDAVLVSGDGSSGFFSGGASSIGIASGIILSTGRAREAEGPNDSTGTSGNASGEPNSAITGLGFTNQDSTSLRFDFTSGDGDVFFDFVFASEEYNEFVDGGFNDAFGFFLDGENIALIPGTTTPVSIDSVNTKANSEFFNNNDNVTPTPAAPDDIEFDGFTTVLTAQALNIGSGLHTIELAISDVGDTILDSAVFLAANTFSNTNDVDPTPPAPPVTPTPTPNPPPTGAVPEPASVVVWGLLLGLGMIGGLRRRNK